MSGKLNRRGFLKGSLAAGGAVGFGLILRRYWPARSGLNHVLPGQNTMLLDVFWPAINYF
jgi:anaerobic selenocysteine-containing dehydrogenase